MGHRGEQRAVAFLLQKNFQILERNIRYKNQEIDIVAFDRDHQELVFIEVKTRATPDHGHPSQAVNHKKIRNLEMIAQFYLETKKLDHDFRFDILAIQPHQIEHYTNITW